MRMEGHQVMSNLPTGTLTVLHTDIENSTILTRHLRAQYPVVLATHQTLLRAAFTASEGWEVDTQGDAFFVVYSRATQAVAAAVQIQQTLATEPWPPSVIVRVRIGMHTGEPIRTTEGYTGLDVIRAARIKEAGHGGQVLLSASTAAIVQDALLDGLSLRDLGAHRLKGLLRPERIFQLLIPDLPDSFPPLQSLDARTGSRLGAEGASVLTTVLFTDIVSSVDTYLSPHFVSARATYWRELMGEQKALIRRALVRYGGHEVGIVGDGCFATFDSPVSAIHCACAIREAVKALGLNVRMGVHAGEVEPEGEGLIGITGQIGACVMRLAGPGEVLVSSPVKDLVVGSWITFTDRGTHTLKGVPGEWPLFRPDVREMSGPTP